MLMMPRIQTVHSTQSLTALVGRIVNDSDESALNELHQHRAFFTHPQRCNLRLSEYLQLLCEHVPLKMSSFTDEAYSITLAKFFHFPDETSQVDCRKYFSAALAVLNKRTWRGELEADKRLGQILQQLVSKHFSYALQEAARNQSSFSRYNWLTKYGTFVVMMPKTLSGSERRSWLEEHIHSSVLSSSDAKMLIQKLIQEKFSELLLDADEAPQVPDTQIRMPWDYLEKLDIPTLAKCVADEKVDTLSEQRRAIQELGGRSLRWLILDVFSAVSHESMSDADLAKKYQLSPATFSRFAGRKWSQMPDLWKNTANLLAHHPQFKEYNPS